MEREIIANASLFSICPSVRNFPNWLTNIWNFSLFHLTFSYQMATILHWYRNGPNPAHFHRHTHSCRNHNIFQYSGRWHELKRRHTPISEHLDNQDTVRAVGALVSFETGMKAHSKTIFISLSSICNTPACRHFKTAELTADWPQTNRLPESTSRNTNRNGT